jgi:hypothetical protein
LLMYLTGRTATAVMNNADSTRRMLEIMQRERTATSDHGPLA